MNDTLQIVFGLIGGLAIFIFGMNLMSECLQKAAGEKMKQILGLLTKNRLLGVLAGALETGDEGKLRQVLSHKSEVLELDIGMRKHHMQRVNKGKCKKSLSHPYMRILYCIDRMGNSCVNLAEVAQNQMNFTYFIGDGDK